MNYNCITRTNYFRVTDEGKYKKLFDGISSDGEIYDFTTVNDNGDKVHGFGMYGDILYDKDDEDRFDCFIDEIREILPPDDAMIIIQVGHEGLRYTTGWALVATKKESKFMSLEDMAIECAGSILGDHFTTRLNY